MNRIWVGLLGVAVVIAGLWLWARHAGSEKRLSPEEPSAPSGSIDRSGDLSGTSAPVRDPSKPIAAAGFKKHAGATRLAKAEVEQLRIAIRAALLKTQNTRTPSESNRPEARDAPENHTPATLDKQYIADAIADIRPLIQECFDLGRAQDPKLQKARVVVQFSIVGDEKLGGVVDESKIDEGNSEDTNSLLLQCVRETMYSLELPAPQGQGRIEVTYPFRFDAAEKPDSGG
jgi:hypothetical protein